MKTCANCGQPVHREEPDNAEYGIGVVDGRRYPETCPNCGFDLD